MRHKTHHPNGSSGAGFIARFVNHVRMYVAARSRRYLAGAAAVVLALVVLLLPSPYVVEMPGPTQDVLGDVDGKPVIDVDGADVFKDSGALLLVTVSATGVPGYPALTAQAVWAWADPSMEVTPREAVTEPGQTADEYQEQVNQQMSGSQEESAVAALSYAKEHAKELDLDAAALDSVTARMHVDDIGGPSAGMMYALGLLDKLTAAKETGGATIAGTGTIDKKGAVGSIGGIRLKMLAAKRDGATWFLAPEANCDEVVGHVPRGLRDVRVSTLDEAYQALKAIGEGHADDLPHCTA